MLLIRFKSRTTATFHTGHSPPRKQFSLLAIYLFTVPSPKSYGMQKDDMLPFSSESLGSKWMKPMKFLVGYKVLCELRLGLFPPDLKTGFLGTFQSVPHPTPLLTPHLALGLAFPLQELGCPSCIHRSGLSLPPLLSGVPCLWSQLPRAFPIWHSAESSNSICPK